VSLSSLGWFVVGGLAGAGVIAPAVRGSQRDAFLAVLIAIVAMNGIYVGVALNSPVEVLLGESVLATVIIAVAARLYQARSNLIVLCVVVHAAVDGLHHFVEAAPVPEWYILACLGFDLAYAAVAVYVLHYSGR